MITDKHWMLENLLCLVSNAQKFTTEGSITIRCVLESCENMVSQPQPQSQSQLPESGSASGSASASALGSSSLQMQSFFKHKSHTPSQMIRTKSKTQVSVFEVETLSTFQSSSTSSGRHRIGTILNHETSGMFGRKMWSIRSS